MPIRLNCGVGLSAAEHLGRHRLEASQVGAGPAAALGQRIGRVEAIGGEGGGGRGRSSCLGGPQLGCDRLGGGELRSALRRRGCRLGTGRNRHRSGAGGGLHALGWLSLGTCGLHGRGDNALLLVAAEVEEEGVLAFEQHRLCLNVARLSAAAARHRPLLRAVQHTGCTALCRLAVPAPIPAWLPAQLPLHWLAAFAINGVLIGMAQRLPLLTPAGWCHAAILGTVLWGCLGVRGWLAVVAYLLLGSLVTRLGFRRKLERGLAEGRGGRRGPENVWGSAATGALLAMVVALAPPAWQPPLLLAFVASFAAKLADTAGSEIGKRWGRHTWLITSLRPVPPGTEGAISLEGTAASLAGSTVMALLGLLLGLLTSGAAVLLVSLVGLVATLLESLIGATAQARYRWLSNEVVNGVQTALAALLALIAWACWAPA